MKGLIRKKAAPVSPAGVAGAPNGNSKRAPTAADVKYGSHARNRFDLWMPQGGGSFPLVLFIHGGGFMEGDKKTIDAGGLRQCLDAGWAVASLNYRLTDAAPAPAQYLDCAHALQTLRHRAKEWNLDPSLVASTGDSAGAGTSLWLAFHPDLADPRSDDPVARQSTRLTCVALTDAQCSYDPRFAEKIGIPRPNFERNPFFLPFYGITKEEIDTPRACERYEKAAPITYLTKGAPPVLISYNHANEEVTATSDLQLVVHHPKLGLALKKRMDALGIECTVQCKGQPGEKRITPVEFIRKQFEKARKARPEK